MYIYVYIHDILPKYQGLPLPRDTHREGKGGLRPSPWCPPRPGRQSSARGWRGGGGGGRERGGGEPRRAAVTPSSPTPLPANPQGPAACRQPALTPGGIPSTAPGARGAVRGTPPPRRAPQGRIPRRGEGVTPSGWGGERAGAAPADGGALGGSVHAAHEVTRGGVGGGEALAGGWRCAEQIPKEEVRGSPDPTEIPTPRGGGGGREVRTRPHGPRVGAPAAPPPVSSARRGFLSRLFAWAGEFVLRDYSSPASFLLGGPERPQRLGTPF